MYKAILALGALGGLALSAPATAAIVPQQGIAGVKLEMSEAQVKSALGEPDDVVRTQTSFGEQRRMVYLERRLRVVLVRFESADLQSFWRVSSVYTRDPGERTKNNVGVGSSKSKLKERYPSARCDGPLCTLGESLPGQRITYFRLKQNRITTVGVGVVLD